MQIRRLGCVDYRETLAAMRSFTASRTPDTPDALWLCAHPPVYTQGLAGRACHVHDPRGIPVVPTDRGGQVTFHGPGQVVAYPLVDLRRLGIYVKEYVFRLEQAVLRVLESVDVTGHRLSGAPGIYVRLEDPFGPSALTGPRQGLFDGLGKIAALGVKVSRHCTYHGVALNVAMDLSPFDGIDPCGYPGLRTIDLSTIGVCIDPSDAADRLSAALERLLSP